MRQFDIEQTVEIRFAIPLTMTFSVKQMGVDTQSFFAVLEVEDQL